MSLKLKSLTNNYVHWLKLPLLQPCTKLPPNKIVLFKLWTTKYFVVIRFRLGLPKIAAVFINLKQFVYKLRSLWVGCENSFIPCQFRVFGYWEMLSIFAFCHEFKMEMIIWKTVTFSIAFYSDNLFVWPWIFTDMFVIEWIERDINNMMNLCDTEQINWDPLPILAINNLLLATAPI